MSLYARSDLMSVSIPSTSGGCGKTHSRPVNKGSVARVWKLDCPPCEAYLKGDHKPKIIRQSGGDKNKGIAPRMEHVADSDPHWSSTPETIPATPDEERIHTVRAELGKEQLKMLEAFAAATAAGLEIPREAMYVLEKNFDPRILKGNVVCLDGHDNPAGAKFCQECGADMKLRAAVEENSYEKMSVAQLKQLCKDEGLPTSGTKAQLVERLS